MLDIYSLLNSAMWTAFLVQVRFTTVFRWTRNTEIKKQVHAIRTETRYTHSVLAFTGRKTTRWLL